MEVAVSRQESPGDVIINLDTLKKMGIVDENFPKINNDCFEKDAMKLDDLVETTETDEYGFSNKYVPRVSYKLEESEKEMQLREIENKLATKYTPDVFKDSLEGRIIKITRRVQVLSLCSGFDNIIKQTYCKMYIVHALHCTLYHKDQSSVSKKAA